MLKQLETRMKEKRAYLTEKWLGEILPLILPEGTWIHNERFLGYKPDYRNNELKLIVEFDGADHYQNAPVIIRDIKKGKIYEDAGYKVVRIPYFIQLNTQTIKMFFGIDVDFDYEFPHGFINKSAVLPASFCEIGTERFFEFICTHGEDIEKEVINSLEEATKRLGSGVLVLPDKLRTIYLKEYKSKIKYHKEIGMFYLDQTLESNWNIVMVTLQSLLEGHIGTHDFLPTIDTECGAVTGFKWMYRVLDNVMDCEVLVQRINVNECVLSVRVGDNVIEEKIPSNSTANELLDDILKLM